MKIETGCFPDVPSGCVLLQTNPLVIANIIVIDDVDNEEELENRWVHQIGLITK